MKPKIPTVKVKSDECAINIGQVIEDGEIVNPGVPHYVHENEWVEILPVMTVREVMQISRLQNSTGDSSAFGENLSDLCKQLSKRVIAWNWTDLMGEEMEQPYDRPDVLERLASEEIMWLLSASSQQESADERKKDLKESENTSLEMAFSPKE